MRPILIGDHSPLPFQMARDQDLLVVDGLGGHQLVLDLESLPGQSEGCLHMRFGMTLMAVLLLLVISRINGARGHGCESG